MDYVDVIESDLGLVRVLEENLRKRVLKSADEARLQALLWWVIWRGTIGQLRELLAAGADPNFIHEDLNPALGLVLRWRSEKDGAVEFFQELIRAGADPTRSVGGKTLLSLACKSGSTQWAIGPILEASPPRKLSQTDLNQALLATVTLTNKASLIERLLSAGASVNHRPTSNNALLPASASALMLASACAKHDAVEVLLSAGADINMKDDEGHTALDYARTDARACRRVIRLLESAGGVSGQPFAGDDDDPCEGFAAAARSPAFKEATLRIQQLLGVKPSPLMTEERKLPGGKGFLLDRNLGHLLMEGRHEQFASHADPALEFVERHHHEMLARGFYLFYSRDIVSRNGDVIAFLPTTDVYRVIAALETNGAGSTQELIAWLRELEKDQPFVITGIGADFIEGKFATPLQDPADIAKRINEICPDDSLTPAEKAAEIERLRRTNRLYLWWD